MRWIVNLIIKTSSHETGKFPGNFFKYFFIAPAHCIACMSCRCCEHLTQSRLTKLIKALLCTRLFSQCNDQRQGRFNFWFTLKHGFQGTLEVLPPDSLTCLFGCPCCKRTPVGHGAHAPGKHSGEFVITLCYGEVTQNRLRQ